MSDGAGIGAVKDGLWKVGWVELDVDDGGNDAEARGLIGLACRFVFNDVAEGLDEERLVLDLVVFVHGECTVEEVDCTG